MDKWIWRHSRYQIENFIIRLNGVTAWGMFKQCMRELRARSDKLNDWDVRREFNIIFTIASNMYQQIKPLTPECMEVLEREFWTEKLKLRAAMELASCGTVSVPTLETIAVMPQKLEVLNFIKQLDRNQALIYLEDRFVPDILSDVLIELEEGANWENMISDAFGIEALTTHGLPSEIPSPKIPLI